MPAELSVTVFLATEADFIFHLYKSLSKCSMASMPCRQAGKALTDKARACGNSLGGSAASLPATWNPSNPSGHFSLLVEPPWILLEAALSILPTTSPLPCLPCLLCGILPCATASTLQPSSIITLIFLLVKSSNGSKGCNSSHVHLTYSPCQQWH